MEQPKNQETQPLTQLSIEEAEKILLISRYDFVDTNKADFKNKLNARIKAQPEFEEVYLQAFDVLDNARIYNKELSSYKTIRRISNWFTKQIINLEIEFISRNQHKTLLFQKSMNFEEALEISKLEINFLENEKWQDRHNWSFLKEYFQELINKINQKKPEESLSPEEKLDFIYEQQSQINRIKAAQEVIKTYIRKNLIPHSDNSDN